MEDEYFQFLESLQPTLQKFLILIRRNPHHLLLDPLASFLTARCGDSLFWLRLPAAIFGVLAVWGLCRLGGLAASLLLAVSLVHIDLSRRADFYALLTALTAWQTWAFFRLLKDARRWPAYAALNTLFLHSHPYAIVLGALQAVFLFKEGPPAQQARRGFLWAWVLAAALFLPWFFFSASALWGKTFFPLDSAFGLWQYGWQHSSAFFLHLPLYLGQATEAWPDYGWGPSARSVVSITYLFLYLTSAYKTWAGGRPGLMRFCHLAIPAGIIAVFALDRVFHYFLAHRQTMWLLPFYLLTVTDGLSFWVKLLPAARQAGALAAAGAAAVILNLPTYWSTTRMQIELSRGYEALARSLASRLLPGDIIASQKPLLIISLLYIQDREAFRQVDMDMSSDGFMGFLLPPGLRLRGNGMNHEVRRVSTGMPQEDFWWMRGCLEDLTVDPPSSVSPLKRPTPR